MNQATVTISVTSSVQCHVYYLWRWTDVCSHRRIFI